MLSQKKLLEISNICYANVAGNFAAFTNPKFRGPAFEWGRFADMQVRLSSSWMFIHAVKGKKTEIDKIAAQYAREIAERLVARAELNIPPENQYECPI